MNVSSAMVVMTAVLAAAWTTATPVVPACTDASMVAKYNAIQAQMKTCQAASGVAMTLPLGVNKKQKLCDVCTDLKTMTIQKALPKCTVTLASVGTIRLQQEFNRLFNPCVGDDDSNTGGDDPTPSPTPAAMTAKPVVVTVTQPIASTSPPPSATPEAPTPTITPAPTTSTPSTSVPFSDPNAENEGNDEGDLIPVVVKDPLPTTEDDAIPATKATPIAAVVEDSTETPDDNLIVVVAPSPTPISSKPKRKDCDY
ncbi:hypothetical protein FI667_g14872, partial [Globisporangium splendens]